ncbi:SA1320 family protein [Streptococcus fryi]
MATDQQYKWLAEQAYWVEKKRNDVEYHPIEGNIYDFAPQDIENGQFQVLAVEDNQTNGMQVMAVAPVVNGVVDYKHITIAYAGTRFTDGNDLEADFNSVVLGQNIATERFSVGASSIRVPVESQVDTALTFAADIRERYPNAHISTTGHSLGGYLASMVAIKNRWAFTVFNAPNSANMLTKSDIEWAQANTDILVNYRNDKDWIGNTGGELATTVRYVEPYQNVGFVGTMVNILTHHGLATWQFDERGNLVDKYGLVVDRTNSVSPVDIDGDGKEDVTLSSINTEPRNLFLSSGALSVFGGETITINPDSLRMLSSHLNMLYLTEIPMLINLCRLCQEKNTKIQGDFETRKQKVEESIVQRFKETRLTDVFYQLHESVGQAVSKKHIFDNLASINTISYSSLPNSACHETGAYFDISPYNSWITTLKMQSGSLYQHCQSEQVGTSSSGLPINPTPSALRCSDILEQTAKHLKDQAEKIFEGRGFREGKKDGISEALTEVLAVEEKNLEQLNISISNAAQLTLSLANHFQQMDEWLSSQITSGSNIDYLTPSAVPSSYQAYLEESHIFDDVKDVLQAFDTQVEQNSQKYARIVGTAFSEAFRSVQASLEDWRNSLSIFNSTVALIDESFSTKVYVESSKEVDDKLVTTRTYWGNLSRLYGSVTTNHISEAKQSFKTLPDKLDIALEASRTASSDMQQLHPALKVIIEEGVYTAFDLDEIVASQKAVQEITHRIIQELSFVVSTISNQMTGRAAMTLVNHLRGIQQLMFYFNKLVGDCFGSQGQAMDASSQGSVSSEAAHFSLNK